MFYRLAVVALALVVPVLAQNASRNVGSFPGATLSERIAAADTDLGDRAGTLVVNVPGTIAGPVTLRANHALVLKAPVTWNAQVTLSGNNAVTCSGAGAAIHTQGGLDLIKARSANDTIRGCTAYSAGSAYLVDGSGSDHLTMQGNDVREMSLVDTSQAGTAPTTNLVLDGNSVSYAKTSEGNVTGANLFWVHHGSITNNAFKGARHGAQWWGGDSNGGWTTAAADNKAEYLTFTGNTCTAIFQSCIWGSMGSHVVVSRNTAHGCGDVCFDTEGGVETEFSANVATECGFGCYAVFFESLNVSFTRNTGIGQPTGGMAVIKHPSGYGPSHVNVVFAKNVFTCTPRPCSALYSEGQSGPIVFENNEVTGGRIAGINYTGTTVIRGNHFKFTQSIGKDQAAIAPNPLVNGSEIDIADNWIESVVPQPAGTTCIAMGWSDFNNSDTHRIERNHCSGFATDLMTENSGQNPGPHGVWVIRGNSFMDGTVQHVAKTANESYSFYPDNRRGDGTYLPASPGQGRMTQR